MTHEVYLTGYGGKTPDDIMDIVAEINGIIFDIRYSARSRNPKFALSNLREFFGDRYKHVGALGNKNYKGGPIAIVDYDGGREAINQSDRPVLLLCVCKKADICHRTTVGDMLRADGFTVTEWGEGEGHPLTFDQEETPTAGQLSLFGG